jgi:hypothetical protein
MSPEIATKKKEIGNFWHWFGQHEEELFQLSIESPEVRRWVDRIQEKLQFIDSHLGCELSLGSRPKRDFFLSAGGIEEGFPWVEALHAAAPQFVRWNIVKFKQRKGRAGTIRLAGLTFSDENVFFRIFDDEGKIGIHLFFAEFDPRLFQMFGEVGFTFLDSLLGEFDVATKVGEIDFLALEDGALRELRPLKELSDTFDHWHERLAA